MATNQHEVFLRAFRKEAQRLLDDDYFEAQSFTVRLFRTLGLSFDEIRDYLPHDLRYSNWLDDYEIGYLIDAAPGDRILTLPPDEGYSTFNIDDGFPPLAPLPDWVVGFFPDKRGLTSLQVEEQLKREGKFRPHAYMKGLTEKLEELIFKKDDRYLAKEIVYFNFIAFGATGAQAEPYIPSVILHGTGGTPITELIDEAYCRKHCNGQQEVQDSHHQHAGNNHQTI